MTQENKDKRKTIINRILGRAAPIVIGASSLISWTPVHSTLTENNRGDNKSHNIEVLANKHSSLEDTPYLALAESGNIDAYSQSIAQVSIATETGDLKNPPAVATGNGYYGQHQLGNSVKNDFCVKKYIAFALVNSSPEFKKSLCNNILTGNQAAKDNLIGNFAESLNKYDEKQKPEQAYMSSNLAYQKLSMHMNVTPVNFQKAHKAFTEEASRLQSQFIYEIYLQQMPSSIKGTIAKNPQIKFESISPAVMASVVAIAVKQGNGKRFKNAMEQATISAYQSQAQRYWSADTSASKSKEPPLAIASRIGDLDREQIVVSGKIIRIYDAENKKIKLDDILVPNGYKPVVIHGTKPKNMSGSREVMAFNVKKHPVNIAEVVNNKEWLKNYCGSFTKVYAKAESQIDKLPTLDTYYEMSMIFNNPELYKIAEDFCKHNQPTRTYAFNDALKNNLLQNKYQNS